MTLIRYDVVDTCNGRTVANVAARWRAVAIVGRFNATDRRRYVVQPRITGRRIDPATDTAIVE